MSLHEIESVLTELWVLLLLLLLLLLLVIECRWCELLETVHWLLLLLHIRVELLLLHATIERLLLLLLWETKGLAIGRARSNNVFRFKRVFNNFFTSKRV